MVSNKLARLAFGPMDDFEALAMVFGAVAAGGPAPPSSGHCSGERSSSGLEAPSTPAPSAAKRRRKSSLRERATPMDLDDDSNSNNAQSDLSDVDGAQSSIGSIAPSSGGP